MFQRILTNRLTILLLLCGVLLALVALRANALGVASEQDGTITLRQPAFLAGVASAAESTNDGIRTVVDEAGITYYADTGRNINLNNVMSVFRTIEAGGNDDGYLIGSVPVTNYGDSEDVHVYVDTDGWIVAYYPIGESVGKIMDWIAVHAGGHASVETKLENVYRTVASAAGAPATGGTYYDFRTPNATKMTIVFEYTTGNDAFDITIPGTFTYEDISYSTGALDDRCCNGNVFAALDGTTFSTLSRDSGWEWEQGALGLSLDTEQTVGLFGRSDTKYVAILMLYSE